MRIPIKIDKPDQEKRKSDRTEVTNIRNKEATSIQTVKVTQSCLSLYDPWSTQSMGFSRPEHWSGEPFPSPGDLPNPGIKPRSPALQADSLPAELPGKPRKTGVGGLSLLQQIFPTQESNWGLLHCRWIIYQLSYQGSPIQTVQLLKE